MTDTQQPTSGTPEQPYQAAPQPAYPVGAPEPIKSRNILGIIALVVAVVGFIFACVPGALIVGWVLLPIAFILGIVGVCLRGKVKWQAIAAIITSVIGTIVGVIVFTALVATSVSDAFGPDETTVGDAAVVEEAATDEAAPAADAPASDVGTRENPAALGAPVSSDDWTVTINSVTLDAGEQVAAANQFNDAAAEGTQYILVNYTVTYTGDDAAGQSAAFATTVDYVTAEGVTFDTLDAFVVGPDEIDTLTTLYPGASVTGNDVLQVPSPVDGVLAVQPGMFADTVFVAVQ